MSRKTFHTYLSGLRRSIGSDHLPDANADGYQVVGVDSDWAAFRRWSKGRSHRRRRVAGPPPVALGLVRGVPFEGVTAGQFEWVFNEQLASRMTGVVATCAVRLANELFARKDFLGVDVAVRAGLKAAPDDADLGASGPGLGRSPGGAGPAPASGRCRTAPRARRDGSAAGVTRNSGRVRRAATELFK